MIDADFDFRTRAPTGPLVRRVERIWYAPGHSPHGRERIKRQTVTPPTTGTHEETDTVQFLTGYRIGLSIPLDDRIPRACRAPP